MIKANCHTDDWKVSIDFDATNYIQRCTDDEIRALHSIQWGGDYQSDWVARYYSESTLGELFGYLAIAGGGFECQIDEESIMAWLKGNHPQLYLEFTEGEE